MGLTGATVLSLGISPDFQSDSTIFAGLLGRRTGRSFGGGEFSTPDGGLYRSINGGATWTEVDEGFRQLSPIAISLSPNFALDSTALIGTLHSGIMRSADGGTTWRRVEEGLTFQRFPAVEFSPEYQTDSTIFAGTFGVVFRSVDGGDSWEQLNEERSISDSRVQGFAVSPAYASDLTLFAGAGTGGILRSTDGGNTWQQITKGITGVTNVRSVAVARNFESDPTLFFSTSDGVVSKSPDGGDTWQQVTKGLSAGSQEDWLLPDVWTIAVSPSFESDSTVMLGTSEGAFWTTNRGEDWARIDLFTNEPPVPAVVFSPDYASDRTVFAGSSQGVLRSSDGGATWEASSGLEGASVWKLTPSPRLGSDGTVFAATISDGVFRSVDGGRSWEAVNEGLTGLRVQSVQVSPAFDSDSTLFAGTTAGLFRSMDGGDSWARVRQGLREGSTFLAVAFSPGFASDSTLFTSTDADGVFRSEDGGESWQPVNHGLRTLGVSTMAVPDNYGETSQLFIGTTRSGLFRGASLDVGPIFEPEQQVATSGQYSLLGWIVVAASAFLAVLLFFAYRWGRRILDRRRPKERAGWGQTLVQSGGQDPTGSNPGE